jgi:hypothetical protein
MTEKAQVVTPTQARQASPRHMNFRVLLFSMALAIVVAAMIYYAIYANPRSPIGVPDEATAPTTTEQSAPPPAP